MGLITSSKSKDGFNPANKKGPHSNKGNLYRLSQSLGKSSVDENSGIDLKLPFKSKVLP